MSQNGDSKKMGETTNLQYVLRILVPVVGLVVGWQEYRMRQLEGFMQLGERYTPADAARDRYDLMREIDDKYPPQWLKRRIDKIEERVDRVERKERGATELPAEGIGG